MQRPRPPALLSGALVALVALVPTPASAAPVPIETIAPAVNGVRVDSLEYRVLSARFEETKTELADAQSRAAVTAAEVDRLQNEDVVLTTRLKAETVAKKAATVGLATARVGLRRLAVATYVNGPQESDDSYDIAAATTQLGHRALTQVVGEQQAAKLSASENELHATIASMTADLAARTTGRVEITNVRAEHDRAQRDADRLTATITQLADAVERARVTANVVGEDFALVALDAYWKAANAMVSADPGCGIPWWALAGITRVESRHGTYGGAHLLANGDVDRPIIGIPLDGTNNTALIPDTDGGQYDGDTVYDHAVGPMQFIPSTWRRWARDGNGDRVKDPNNIYDAALAAAYYLCASGPMQTDDDMRRGFYSYNHSDAYAQTVLNFAKNYAKFPLSD